MAQVLKFRRRLNVFAPEVTAAMGNAYEEAISRLHGGESELVIREVVAKRIVKMARTGETDPHRLCDTALFVVGGPRAA